MKTSTTLTTLEISVILHSLKMVSKQLSEQGLPSAHIDAIVDKIQHCREQHRNKGEI
jgi:hypothetical protein